MAAAAAAPAAEKRRERRVRGEAGGAGEGRAGAAATAACWSFFFIAFDVSKECESLTLHESGRAESERDGERGRGGKKKDPLRGFFAVEFFLFGHVVAPLLVRSQLSFFPPLARALPHLVAHRFRCGCARNVRGSQDEHCDGVEWRC